MNVGSECSDRERGQIGKLAADVSLVKWDGFGIEQLSAMHALQKQVVKTKHSRRTEVAVMETV